MVLSQTYFEHIAFHIMAVSCRSCQDTDIYSRVWRNQIIYEAILARDRALSFKILRLVVMKWLNSCLSMHILYLIRWFE